MKIMDFLIGRLGWAFLGAVIGFFYGSALYLILRYFLLNSGYLSVVSVFASVFAVIAIMKGEGLADVVANAIYAFMGALTAFMVLISPGAAASRIDRVDFSVSEKERSGFMFFGLGAISVLFVFILDFWQRS